MCSRVRKSVVRVAGRRIHRLQGHANVLADDLGRRTVDPWHLGAHAAPGFAGAPQQVRQPGEARFAQHQPQRWKLLEHALGEEAQELRFERRRLRDVVLHPVGRPARRHRRVPVGAAGVDADGEPVLFGRRVDRPVWPASEQHVAHGEQQHLDETPIRRHSLDLGDRALRIVHRHQDGGAEPRLAVEQLLRDPVVDGGAQRHRHVLVEQRDGAVQHVADGEAASRTDRAPGCGSCRGRRRAARTSAASPDAR